MIMYDFILFIYERQVKEHHEKILKKYLIIHKRSNSLNYIHNSLIK